MCSVEQAGECMFDKNEKLARRWISFLIPYLYASKIEMIRDIAHQACVADVLFP